MSPAWTGYLYKGDLSTISNIHTPNSIMTRIKELPPCIAWWTVRARSLATTYHLNLPKVGSFQLLCSTTLQIHDESDACEWIFNINILFCLHSVASPADIVYATLCISEKVAVSMFLCITCLSVLTPIQGTWVTWKSIHILVLSIDSQGGSSSFSLFTGNLAPWEPLANSKYQHSMDKIDSDSCRI